MKLSKEFQVGLLTLISGTILYFGFNYLKGENLLASAHYYYVMYDDVGGLQTSNPVKVSGLIVGRVSDISIMQDQGSQVKVEFEVEDHIQVQEGAVAVLEDDGLLGGKMISLKLGKGKQLEDYATVEGKNIESMSATLQSRATPLMESMDTVMANVNLLLRDYAKMSGDVQQTVKSANEAMIQTSALITSNRAGIQKMLRDFSTLSSKLVEQQEKLDPILNNMNTISDSISQVQVVALAGDMRNTLAQLNQTLEGINQAEGTMGKLMKDEELYNNMNQTMQDIDKLVVDLKENPKRYVHFSVFGRKDKKEDKKEDEKKEE